KKDITVDRVLFDNITPAQSNAITALSNGVGAVICTFSQRVFMNDIEADNCEARYRGGAFAFIQSPLASTTPADDGRIALENQQIRRLFIRNCRANQTTAGATGTDALIYGGAIYMSGRPGVTTTFRHAFLGG